VSINVKVVIGLTALTRVTKTQVEVTSIMKGRRNFRVIEPLDLMKTQ